MLESSVVADSIRLIAVDIDGTVLNPQFQISETALAALRNARRQGIEVILVTGRRHTFALPIAQQLGFDLWLICSNGAVTRSLRAEPFNPACFPLKPVAIFAAPCKNSGDKPLLRLIRTAAARSCSSTCRNWKAASGTGCRKIWST